MGANPYLNTPPTKLNRDIKNVKDPKKRKQMRDALNAWRTTVPGPFRKGTVLDMLKLARELAASQGMKRIRRQFKTIPFDHYIEVVHTTEDPHSWDAKLTVDFYGKDKVFWGEGDARSEAIKDLKKWTKKQYPGWF